MKKRISQVFSLALVVALMIAFAIPAHADVSDAAGYVVGEFWDMMSGKEYDMYFDYWKNFAGYLAGEECPSSPDKYHHGNVPVGGIGVFGSGGTDSNGKFVYHICDYCQKQFKVYASDLQQSYEAQVKELPATGYTFDGSLLFTLNHYRANVISGSYNNWCSCGGTSTVNSKFSLSFDCSSNSIFITPSSGKDSFCLTKCYVEFKAVAPVSGYYATLEGPSFNLSSFNVDGTSDSASSSYKASIGLGVHYNAGDNIFKITEKNYASSVILSLLKFQAFSPVYKITPDTASTGTTYNINSRPTSITGNYGIIGDNGQITKVEGNTIVNETNNNYYNPATGETKIMSDWSYNYEDRSYTVTTQTGDTVTITYGDENVTIKEGDTIYNVYYLVNGGGSGNPGPGPDVPPACNHQWTEASTTPATCTVPGSRSLTCSLCNQTKTETIPAPGHKWTIKQEVRNEYDSSGNQTQEGYTIWECSVCGEQQKTIDGTAPPGGGGSGSGSSGGVFSGIFGLLVDFLGFFWNTFRDFVGEGVKGFLNALMDGTSSIFGLLNPFNWGG